MKGKAQRQRRGLYGESYPQQGKKVCIAAEGDAGFYLPYIVADKPQADGIRKPHPGIPPAAAGALAGPRPARKSG